MPARNRSFALTECRQKTRKKPAYYFHSPCFAQDPRCAGRPPSAWSPPAAPITLVQTHQQCVSGPTGQATLGPCREAPLRLARTTVPLSEGLKRAPALHPLPSGNFTRKLERHNLTRNKRNAEARIVRVTKITSFVI